MSIHPSAIIDPDARLGEDVEIGPLATIGPQVTIGARTSIGAQAHIDRLTTIGEDCKIFPHTCLGTPPQDLGYAGEDTELIIGDRVTIREYGNVNRGTVKGGGRTTIGSDTYLMAYTHVGHDCHVGSDVILVTFVGLSGHVTVEDGVTVSGFSGVHQFVRLGRHSFVGGFARVTKDVPPYVIAQGTDDFKLYGPNVIGLRRKGYSKEVISAIRESFRIIFRGRALLKDALAEAEASFPDVEEVRIMIEFIRGSERGVLR